MPSARFTIDGDPSSNAGFDATASSTLSLQLEASPALDVTSCVYAIPLKTAGAPSLTLSSSGVASPPTAAVTLPIPAGSAVYSFVVRCVTNNGEPVRDAQGKLDYSANVFERIVSVRGTSSGLKKILIGERLEYDPVEGWVGAFNEVVDAVEGLAGGSVALSDDPPEDVLASSTGADPGADTEASRADHVHAVPVATNGSVGFVIGEISSAGEANKVAVYDVNGAFGATGFNVGLRGTTLASFLCFPPYDLGDGGPINGTPLPAIDGLLGSPLVFAELSGTSSSVPAPTNWPVGSILILAFKQGSGGGKTISAWDSVFKFGTITNALLGSAAGETDVYVFVQLFVNQWLAVARAKIA